MKKLQKSRHHFIFLFFLLNNFVLFSQAPAVQWTWSEQSGLHPGDNTEDWIYSVVQTSDGGYIGAGYVEVDFLGDDNYTRIPTIVKVDKCGAREWERLILNGTESGYCDDVIEVSDGTYMIRGVQGLRCLITKIDLTGTILSTNYYGITELGTTTTDPNVSDIGNNYSSVREIINSGVPDGFIIGTTYSTTISGIDTKGAMLIRLNNDLTVRTSFGTNGYEMFSDATPGMIRGRNVRVIYNSGVAVGFVFVGMQSIDNTPGYFVNTKGWIVRTDISGTILWQRTFGRSDLTIVAQDGVTIVGPDPLGLNSCGVPPPVDWNVDVKAFSVEQLSDTELAVNTWVDYFEAEVGSNCFYGNPGYPNISAKVVLLKVDLTNLIACDFTLQKYITSFEGVDFFTPMIPINNGIDGFYFAGNIPYLNANGSGDKGLNNKIVKTDIDGTIIWQDEFLGDEIGVPTGQSTGFNNCLFAMAKTNDGGLVIAGNNEIEDENQYIVKLTFNPVQTLLVNSTTICAGQTATLNASGVVSYVWSTGATTNLINVTPFVTTTYTVTGTLSDGCTATAVATVTVNPAVNSSLTSTDVKCLINDGTATVIASGGTGSYSYLWNDPSSQTTLTASNLMTGSYTVTVTDGVGCTSTSVATLNPTFTYPVGITLTSNLTLTGGTYKVNGNIVVPDGKIFTVSSAATIEFAENSGIIIESGGTMNLNGASILKGISTCNNMWDGITVNGNINSFDFGGTLNINNATIRDARIGVNALWGTFVFNWTYTGTVKAIAANFINDRVGIKMEGRDFMRSTSSINSIISACMFTCNAPLLDVATYSGEGTENFIQLESVRELNINNNIFTGNTSFASDKRAVGISSLNSNFTADGNNQFNNLTRGVESKVTDVPRQVVVDGNTFTDTQEGIYIQNGELDVIKNNMFNIPDPILPILKSYGLFFETTSGFNIENNDFVLSSSGSGTNPGTYGMAFDGTGATGGIVFNNRVLPNLAFGLQAQENNINLKIRCNTFANPLNYSIAVLNDVSLSYLKQQGTDCLANDNPAGNEWTSCSGVKNIFVESDGFGQASFDYYAHNSGLTGDTKPLCSTASWASSDLTICTSQPKISTSCDDPFLGLIPAPPNSTYTAYFAAIKNLIVSYYAKIDALKLQIPSVSASMDKGNKQSLLNAINSSMSPGQLKNLLTGPLSDEVIIATIKRTSPVPPGTLKNILYPQAPLSVAVLNALETISLPSGIKNNIYSAQSNSPTYTKLDDLLKQIEFWRGEIALLESEYQRQFIVYNDKVCKKTCINSRLIESKMLLTEAYLNENKLDSARTVLAEIVAADATVISTVEKQNYVDYMNVLLSLADNSLNIKQMNSGQIASIEQIANTPTRAGKKAEIARQVATGQKTIHTIANISSNSNHSMFVPEEDAETLNEKAKLYPNPNNGTMQFEYSLSEFEKGELSIYDVTGRKIADYELSTGSKIITVSETGLTNGIYFYIYKINDSIEKSDKIVIIK